MYNITACIYGKRKKHIFQRFFEVLFFIFIYRFIFSSPVGYSENKIKKTNIYILHYFQTCFNIQINVIPINFVENFIIEFTSFQLVAIFFSEVKIEVIPTSTYLLILLSSLSFNRSMILDLWSNRTVS